MKFGIRTPSVKKSLRARTTGKLKRNVKKAIIPWYGKKGMFNRNYWNKQIERLSKQ